MASVDWLKLKGAIEAKAKLRHCETDVRKRSKHSNKDIDTSRTYLNEAFGAFAEVPDGYKRACEKYDAYIAELDAKPGANKRKDRVTLVGLEVPQPKGMDDAQAREWFAKVYGIFEDMYGAALIGGAAHFDEVHRYKDTVTGEWTESRPHLHMYVVPDVGGKLHAKSFTARKNMVRANNAVERMTEDDYPGFKFQTGEKRKSRKTVEELKNESAVLEAAEQAEKEAQAEVQRQSREILEKAARSSLETKAKARRTAQDVMAQAEAREKKAREMYAEASQALQKASETLEAVQSTLKEAEAAKEAQSASDSAKLQRALQFMEGIKLSKAGTTARKSFETREIMQGHTGKTARNRQEISARAEGLSCRIAGQRRSHPQAGYEHEG